MQKNNIYKIIDKNLNKKKLKVIMKILLMMPRYLYLNKDTKLNYNYSFPMGLSYIYSIIKKKSRDKFLRNRI